MTKHTDDLAGSPDADFSPTARWTAAHLAGLKPCATTTLPIIDPDLPRPLFPDLDLWDMWPLQTPDGTIAAVNDAELWFILSAPRLPDPDLRHAVARIRLVERRHGRWIDHGNAFPDAFSPGSREWAGSAVYIAESGAITLYFTAAGTRGDARDNWQQRLFAATGRLRWGAPSDPEGVQIGWQAPTEIVVADNVHYQPVTPTVGRAGFIKGFRDPAYFADPADSREYLLFTASLVGAQSDYDGAVGLAVRCADGKWALRPPLVSMDGVNNEPERPHIVYHAGRYYMFFSTQTRMFAPQISAGPNGLYAMVADHMAGPWTPLNGSGLIAANPNAAPQQAYSWWVTPELSVYGFVDVIGPGAASPVDDADWRRAHFGGVPAPVFQLELNGKTGRICPAG